VELKMADPNSAPVSDNSGALAPGSLQSDIGQINQEYEPEIKQSEEASAADETQAVGFANKGADEAATAASDATSDDAQVKQWADSTPTRQAAYATAMHTAPVLAMLVAIGGSMTKIPAQAMLAATTGIVQGMNAGAEKQYTDSYNAWMANYEKLKKQHADLMQAHSLMLESYQGRADAYQKAAEAARRQTGDLLDQKQQKIANTIDSFKAQSAAIDRLARNKIALEQLHERQLKDAQQAAHWKQIDRRANAADPRTKALIGAAKQKYTDAKAQMDAAMKYRGQVSSDLSMSDDAKGELMTRIDEQLAELSTRMDEASQEAETLAQSIPAAAPGGPAPPPLRAASPPGAPAPASYKTPDDVRQALAAGKISKQKAKSILVQQFGFKDTTTGVIQRQPAPTTVQ
jgi:hypothetical protein